MLDSQRRDMDCQAKLGDVITLDFINTGLEPGARAGIELTLEQPRSCALLSTGRLQPPSSRRRKSGARAPRPGSFGQRHTRDEAAAADGKSLRIDASLSGGYGPDDWLLLAKSESQHNLAEVCFAPHSRRSQIECFFLLKQLGRGTRMS